MSSADVGMEQVLRRSFVDEAVEGLFGLGPERALATYRSFVPEGARACAIIECPLLGPPSYDVLVGSHGDSLQHATLAGDGAPACYAAFEWAAGLPVGRRIELFFERDADGHEDRPAGIHCRHYGDLGAACGFFGAIGEGWRAPLYQAVAEKLPEGWQAVYAAAFLGRPGSPTRLELITSREERERMARRPEHLAACFDRIGFTAYDGPMLKTVSRLAAISALNSLQFDILADGVLGNTFSITSCYERTGADFERLFQDDGAVGRVNRAYEDLGMADGRWRLAQQAVFATVRPVLIGARPGSATSVSLPNCGKAKWIGTCPQPAKIYLLMGTFVEG